VVRAQAYIAHPLFEQACRRSYGDGVISAFRIMFFNKPAGKGTHLPYHQDRWQHLDKDPLLTVWTALDDSSTLNGAVPERPTVHARNMEAKAKGKRHQNDELPYSEGNKKEEEGRGKGEEGGREGGEEREGGDKVSGIYSNIFAVCRS